MTLRRFFARGVLFSALAALLSTPIGAAARKPPLPTQSISITHDGKSRAGFEAVLINDVPCLSLRDIQKLLGGQESWKGMSRRVVYDLNGNSAEFTLDAASATVQGQKVKLETVPRFWVGRMYLPVSLLATAPFQELADSKIEWDKDNAFLKIETKPSVSSPVLHSLEDKTRIVLELGSRVNYRVMEERPRRILIRFFGGRTTRDEGVQASDGLIESARLTPRGRSSDLLILLTPAADRPRVKFDPAERRFMVEVYPKEGVTPVRGETTPAPVVEPSGEKPAAEPSAPASDDGQVPAPELDQWGVPVLEGAPSAEPTPAPDMPAAPGNEGDQSAAGDALSATLAKRSPIKTIVIDAGHGGKDAGAIGSRGTMEKDINLDIALALRQALRKDKRFKVIMTRERDDFIPLAERTKIANDRKADLFISIHCNAALSHKSNGFEIYFLSENATDDAAAAVARRENAVLELEGVSGKAKLKVNELLWAMARTETMNASSEAAALIAQEVRRRLNVPHRGVKQAGFYVLKGANMPAVLVESAFITHAKEEGMLRSDRFQSTLAESLRAGILNYERRKLQTKESKLVGAETPR